MKIKGMTRIKGGTCWMRLWKPKKAHAPPPDGIRKGGDKQITIDQVKFDGIDQI